MGNLVWKNVRDMKTFEVEGSLDSLEKLLKKLKSGDSIDLEIDELPDFPNRFLPSLNPEVITEEAWISLSCPNDRYSDFISYLKNFNSEN